jgi:uncharacterized MAPEG superfamily protein
MTALTAVLLYAGWTLLLPLFYAGARRVPLIAAGKMRADAWERGQPVIDPPLLVRLRNAHMNCAENLPAFAAVVFAALLLGKADVVDPLAGYVFYGRVAQSLVHASGTSTAQIALRGFLFAAQSTLIGYMLVVLLLR